MKIDKNTIKELTDYLNEFNLTEIEYTDKDIKIKVSKEKLQNMENLKKLIEEISSRKPKNYEQMKIEDISKELHNTMEFEQNVLKKNKFI